MSITSFQYRILIVDDEPTLRTLGKHLLEAQGYEVLCVEDGLVGLAALRASLPDLIISDLAMPNMDGFEFLSVVRRRFPRLPVLVISGEFTERSVPENVLADAFFPKGRYEIHKLFETVAALVSRPPVRQPASVPTEAAVWARIGQRDITVSCSECLHTFPVVHKMLGEHRSECVYCGASVLFTILEDRRRSPRTIQLCRENPNQIHEVENWVGMRGISPTTSVRPTRISTY